MSGNYLDRLLGLAQREARLVGVAAEAFYFVVILGLIIVGQNI